MHIYTEAVFESILEHPDLSTTPPSHSIQGRGLSEVGMVLIQWLFWGNCVKVSQQPIFPPSFTPTQARGTLPSSPSIQESAQKCSSYMWRPINKPSVTAYTSPRKLELKDLKQGLHGLQNESPRQSNERPCLLKTKSKSGADMMGSPQAQSLCLNIQQEVWMRPLSSSVHRPLYNYQNTRLNSSKTSCKCQSSSHQHTAQR